MQVAWAHVRGGGELGRPWHAAGRRERRGSALQDYLACARHLSHEGAVRLAGHATSAGEAQPCRTTLPVPRGT